MKQGLEGLLGCLNSEHLKWDLGAVLLGRYLVNDEFRKSKTDLDNVWGGIVRPVLTSTGLTLKQDIQT